MKNKTMTVVLSAPKNEVFAFLSQIQNLPKWAIHFCKSLERVGDEYYVESPKGRILFRQQCDESTGVIDNWGGPDESCMEYFPSRLLDLGDGKCAYSMTIFQLPNTPDEEFAGMCAALGDEYEALRKRVEKA